MLHFSAGVKLILPCIKAQRIVCGKASVSLLKSSCQYNCVRAQLKTSEFNESLWSTFCLCGWLCISWGRSSVTTATTLFQRKDLCMFSVIPVLVLARSPLPEPRAQQGWPGSRHCWPSWWSRCAVYAGSGKPLSSPVPRRRSTQMCTRTGQWENIMEIGSP